MTTTSTISKSRGRGLFLRASPIDVSTIVRERLLDRMRATVLTSATLAVDGSFDYVRGRLGLRRGPRAPPAVGVRLRASGHPVPAATHAGSALATLRGGGGPRDCARFSRGTRGRAFVLFTSYAMLRRGAGASPKARSTTRCSCRAARRARRCSKQFRATPHAVLFATSSFWQGVDVIGEALSCVIIDKLPFASPADPITAARIEAIAARGGDPFGEYQVPLAILTLQQGLGRLIRHRERSGRPRDPRPDGSGPMAYGPRFLALPAARPGHPRPLVRDFSTPVFRARGHLVTNWPPGTFGVNYSCHRLVSCKVVTEELLFRVSSGRRLMPPRWRR